MSGAPTLSDFFAAWELFADPALAGAIAGAMLGAVGVYVVLRRLVFLSAAASQAAGLGVAASFYLQHLGVAAVLASPLLGATGLTLGALALVLGTDRGQTTSARRDGVLGVVFLAASAGTIALGARLPQEMHDIESLLFGTAVAVLPEDFELLAAVAAGVLAVHAWAWRGFVASSFDPDGATTRGVPVRVVEAALIVTLALALGTATRVVGALPTFAFSVLPAMTALTFAANVQRALVAAALIGAAQGFLGYVGAFLFELPVGACQALAGVALWGVAAGAARATRSIRGHAAATP